MKTFRKICFSLICSALVFGAVSCEDSDDSPASSTTQGEVSSPKLSFVYGGVKANPVEDPNVQIANLRINGRSGLSYSWANGTSLKAWGLADSDAGALACAFYLDGNTWKGGKFDWISTSRRTRDFINLNGGYHGWEPEKFYAAPKRGFCIVSANGKKRSNFITE